MAEQNKALLRFQLIESVWLDHHARSAEITSLSLEPNVEIEEDSGFVTIKGYLELIGRFDTVDEGENTLDLESSSLAEQLHYEPFRVEQKEIYQKEYKGKIKQHFPVDITVPAEKVSDIGKVYMNIDQFDYSISDQHRLNIEADIEISGISTESKKDVLLAKKGNELRAETLYPEFDVAAMRDDIEKEEGITDETHLNYPHETPTFDYAGNLSRLSVQEGETEEDRLDKAGEVQRIEAQRIEAQRIEAQRIEAQRIEAQQIEAQQIEAQQIEAQRIEAQERNAEQVDHVEVVKVQEEFPDTQEDREYEYEYEADSIELEKQEIKTNFHSSSSVDEHHIEESAENERTSDPTATFLSQLMSFKEDPENEVTRLKMCIIQREESLEDIAKRYELRLTEIMRYNRLETQEVRAGQVLYIPIS